VLERYPVIRQVYVTGAVLAFVGTFMPILAPGDGDDGTRSLWTSLSSEGGEGALVGLVLALVMMVAALSASRVRHGVAAPVVVVVAGALGVLMLVLKPGEGASPPPLGAGGGLLLGTAVLLVSTALYDVLDPPDPPGRS
jgi:hypothetical protein